MPALKGSEISRAGHLDDLPDWLLEQIRRDREDPRCAVCKRAMHPLITALGWDTHPTCGPFDRPEPSR